MELRIIVIIVLITLISSCFTNESKTGQIAVELEGDHVSTHSMVELRVKAEAKELNLWIEEYSLPALFFKYDVDRFYIDYYNMPSSFSYRHSVLLLTTNKELLERALEYDDSRIDQIDVFDVDIFKKEFSTRDLIRMRQEELSL